MSSTGRDSPSLAALLPHPPRHGKGRGGLAVPSQERSDFAEPRCLLSHLAVSDRNCKSFSQV